MELSKTALGIKAPPAGITWGRKHQAGWVLGLAFTLFVAACPLLVHTYWVALEHYHGSLSAALNAIVSRGFRAYTLRYLPKASSSVFLGYGGWLLFQALLYAYLPGTHCKGQRTPGGHLLTYTANGLNAWIVTHALYIGASVIGLLDPAIIARNWEGLLVAVNIYGFALALFAQLKGYIAPTFPEDRKITGSWIFDFFAGVELNPRLGANWDLKFFHNGRPGIVAWTLIDISWASYQYQEYGYISRSMALVLIFQAMYVVDFFYNEDWYTRTIDISHDHFGFMLAWGDTTYLPTMYTLQAQYLGRYPVHLTRPQTLAILLLGLAAYAAFRSANYQRDYVRARNGNAEIWGRPAKYIKCTYRTADGKEHQSLLLTSGWWGVARHANYLADLVQSWCMCAACGFTHVVPWFYFIFMSVFLVHRARRDERRCRAKYGEKWEQYCQIVRYRIIPGIY